MLRTIISGGQTGVDQGALEAALEFGVMFGGWAPPGWKTENGQVPEKFRFNAETGSGLIEMQKSFSKETGADYARRTVENIIFADATLILWREAVEIGNGTRLTEQHCEFQKKPFRRFRIGDNEFQSRDELIYGLIVGANVRVLNVAGPQEKHAPGIQQDTKLFMLRLLEQLDKSRLVIRSC